MRIQTLDTLNSALLDELVPLALTEKKLCIPKVTVVRSASQNEVRSEGRIVLSKKVKRKTPTAKIVRNLTEPRFSRRLLLLRRMFGCFLGTRREDVIDEFVKITVGNIVEAGIF